MKTPVVQNVGHETSIVARKTSCVHQRLIETVLTRSGERTGKVRCLECGALIDDPYLSRQQLPS